MLSFLLACSFAALIVLNLWATSRIARDTLAFPAEKHGWFLLVWCLPIIGTLLVLYLMRDELERASGRYRRGGDPAEAMEALQDGLSGPHDSD